MLFFPGQLFVDDADAEDDDCQSCLHSVCERCVDGKDSCL